MGSFTYFGLPESRKASRLKNAGAGVPRPPFSSNTYSVRSDTIAVSKQTLDATCHYHQPNWTISYNNPSQQPQFFFSSKTNKTHTGLELSEFLELMEIHRHEQTRSVKYKPSFFN